MTRDAGQLHLAIQRLRAMRRDRERTPPPKPGESRVRLLVASSEAIALDAAIEALVLQLKAVSS